MGFRGAPPTTDTALDDLVDVDGSEPGRGGVPVYDEQSGAYVVRPLEVDELAPGPALEGDVPTFDEAAGTFLPRPLPTAPQVVFHGTDDPETARPAANNPWSLYVRHSS